MRKKEQLEGMKQEVRKERRQKEKHTNKLNKYETNKTAINWCTKGDIKSSVVEVVL